MLIDWRDRQPNPPPRVRGKRKHLLAGGRVLERDRIRGRWRQARFAARRTAVDGDDGEGDCGYLVEGVRNH